MTILIVNGILLIYILWLKSKKHPSISVIPIGVERKKAKIHDKVGFNHRPQLWKQSSISNGWGLF